MKSAIALTVAILTGLGTLSTFAQDTGDPVTIEKERILVPGTKITEKDQRDMNAILAKFDKRLYKLKGYDKGKATKMAGALRDSAIDKATAARAAKHAKDKQFTGSTLQIGFTSNQDISGFTSNQDIGQTSNQDIAGRTSNQDVITNQNLWDANASKRKRVELVKRLTPILRKYSKPASAQ